MDFLKASISKIWEGFLQNLGVLITAFLLSGGYLVAINKLQKFQDAVRSIPSDYFLTPLVLLLVLFGVVLRINRHQEQKLSELTKIPVDTKEDARFVTHFGVWWKGYPDAEYIEDFPYCACCDPRLKLVQTEWHPDEVFKCSKTGTEYKLYDKVPQEREQILSSLYDAYFNGLSRQFEALYTSEFQRIKQLEPNIADADLTRRLFEMEPLCQIPAHERDAIIEKNQKPMSALLFVNRHYASYRKYLKKVNDRGSKTGPHLST